MNLKIPEGPDPKAELPGETEESSMGTSLTTEASTIIGQMKKAKVEFEKAKRTLKATFNQLQEWVEAHGSSIETKPWEDKAEDFSWALAQLPHLVAESQAWRAEQLRRAAAERAERERQQANNQAQQLEAQAREFYKQASALRQGH